MSNRRPPAAPPKSDSEATHELQRPQFSQPQDGAHDVAVTEPGRAPAPGHLASMSEIVARDVHHRRAVVLGAAPPGYDNPVRGPTVFHAMPPSDGASASALHAVADAAPHNKRSTVGDLDEPTTLNASGFAPHTNLGDDSVTPPAPRGGPSLDALLSDAIQLVTSARGHVESVKGSASLAASHQLTTALERLRRISAQLPAQLRDSER